MRVARTIERQVALVRAEWITPFAYRQGRISMALKTAQVYLIDGDAAARESATAMLRKRGLKVHSFDSAKAFLSAYDGYRPGCIIADMWMPGMSGSQLLVELRRRGLTIPVIILTPHADTPTTVLAMKSGAFTTLDKPSESTELWDPILDALHEDIQRSEEDKRRQEARQRLAQLTSRERDVLKHLLAGDPHKVIAHRLRIGLRTVEARRKTLFLKAKVESIAELIKLVMLAEPELLPSESTPRSSDSPS
jgi:two-component system response regulator FixJ